MLSKHGKSILVELEDVSNSNIRPRVKTEADLHVSWQRGHERRPKAVALEPRITGRFVEFVHKNRHHLRDKGG